MHIAFLAGSVMVRAPAKVNLNGNHDCIFLTGIPVEPTAARELEPGEAVPLTRRVCGIYPVRPLQCRTWPFWPENLINESAWKRAARGCPGMDRGGRHFERGRIEELRDTKDWPANPPTSGAATAVRPPAGATGDTRRA